MHDSSFNNPNNSSIFFDDKQDTRIFYQSERRSSYYTPPRVEGSFKRNTRVSDYSWCSLTLNNV